MPATRLAGGATATAISTGAARPALAAGTQLARGAARWTSTRCRGRRRRWWASTTGRPSARPPSPPAERVREMRSATVRRRGEFVELELVAEGFLRGLARSIAGALAEVGRGRRPPAWVGEILRAQGPAAGGEDGAGRGPDLDGSDLLGNPKKEMSKQKTWTAKAADLKSDWFVVDATDQVLGRLASSVAKVLRGKHKPTFTPHLNSGDHVIVINASKVKVTRHQDDDQGVHALQRLPRWASHAHAGQGPGRSTRHSRSPTRCGACSSATRWAPTCSPAFASTPARTTSTWPRGRRRITFDARGDIKIG